MPLECVAIMKAAQNQIVSGRCERCMTVPAVTEVSLRQVLHAKVSVVREGMRHAARPPHPRQTKPSGQRVLARCSAHAASSGNIA